MKYTSAASGKCYYHNRNTGKSQLTPAHKNAGQHHGW